MPQATAGRRPDVPGQRTIIRQLGPASDTGSPAAASTLHGSPPAACGPYPSLGARSSEGNLLLCSLPQAQLDGPPPSLLCSWATAVSNAALSTGAAVPDGLPGGLNTGLSGSVNVHRSRT